MLASEHTYYGFACAESDFHVEEHLSNPPYILKIDLRSTPE
jgi:hypothetical protein